MIKLNCSLTVDGTTGLKSSVATRTVAGSNSATSGIFLRAVTVSGAREAAIPHPGMAVIYLRVCPHENSAKINTHVFKTYSTLPTVPQANGLGCRSLNNPEKKIILKISNTLFSITFLCIIYIIL